MKYFCFFLALCVAPAFGMRKKRAHGEPEAELKDKVATLEAEVNDLQGRMTALEAAPTPDLVAQSTGDSIHDKLGRVLKLNPYPGGALIPALVPGTGETFELANQERIDELGENSYGWQLIRVEDKNNGDQYVNENIANLDGNLISSALGWVTTTVSNRLMDPLFKIQMTKNEHNPFRWSWSFRILNAETDDILFTINKDWFGTGMFWSKDEWRIYRGRKRDGEQIYHCVSSYTGFSFQCYHSKDEYNNDGEPCAEISQSFARHYVGLNDKFRLKVHEQEDAALLLAASVIVDMVHEQEHGARNGTEESKEMVENMEARGGRWFRW